MQQSKNILALVVTTFALVFFGIILQFSEAANSVAVFRTQGITSTAAVQQVGKTLDDTAGLASVQINGEQGIILAVFDSRAVDPRSVSASLTRSGYPTSIGELMTVAEYKAAISGGAGCNSGGCGDCSKK